MKNTNFVVYGTFLAVALAAPAVANAQTMDGRWHADVRVNGYPCTLDLVMNGGRYSELARCGSMMTLQSGTYAMTGGLLVRTVLDFEPKQRYVVDGRPLGYDYRCPNGQYTCPGWYGGPGGNYPLGPGGHYEPNATPPGGTYTVTLNAQDMMTWRDMHWGGTITFVRVR
jgi:hypothetical protein